MAKFSHEHVGGVIPPLLTPAKKGGELDEDGSRELVNHVLGPTTMEKPYVNGLFVGGLTGGFLWLPEQTRKDMLDVTVEEADGRAPVLFNATDLGADEQRKKGTVELCHYGQEHGADAIVVAPFLVHRSNSGMHEVMAEIAGETELPVYAYINVFFASLRPRITDSDLKIGVFQKLLAEIDNFWGMKYSCVGLRRFEFYKKTAEQEKPGSVVLMGDQDKALHEYASHGCVPSIGNIGPDRCSRIYDESKSEPESGETDAFMRAATSTFHPNGRISTGIIYGASLMGICDNICLEPGEPLSEMEREDIYHFMRDYDYI